MLKTFGLAVCAAAAGILLLAFEAHAQIVPAQNQVIPAPYGQGFVISTSTSATHKLGTSLVDLAGSFVTGILPISRGGTGTTTNPFYWARNAALGYLYPATLTDKVGIGTASPTEKLTITSGNILLSVGNALRWGSDAQQIFGDGTDLRLSTITGSTGDITLETDGTTRLTVTGTGNVGIGTTSPGYGLTLDGATDDKRTIAIGDLPVAFVPNQTDFFRSVAFGNGLRNMTHTTGVDGWYNTAVGVDALLYAEGTGNVFGNTAVGAAAGGKITTGHDNTAVGYETMYGYGAGVTGYNNSAFGPKALYSLSTGINNTAIGVTALYSNTTGESNTALGVDTLFDATSTIGNTSLGYSSGRNITTGSYNTFLGINTGGGITTGENNTIIGARVTGLSPTLSDTVIIAQGDGTQRITATAASSSLYSAILNLENPGTGAQTSQLSLNGGDGTNGGSYLRFKNNGTTLNYIGQDSALNGGTSSDLDYYSIVGGHRFFAGVLERMRIDSSGNVGIATTTPGYALTVVGTTSASAFLQPGITDGCAQWASGFLTSTGSVCGSGGGSGTVTSVAATVPIGLTVSGSPITTSGTLAFGLDTGYTIPLIASTTEWAQAYASTTALSNSYIRGLFSNTATGLTYNSTTGATSLTSGYTIPLTASTTDWNTAYLNRITSASSPLSIASNAISISQANTSTNGYLSSTDWNLFNNKVSSTSLSATAPLTYNSGTGVFAMPAATSGQNGYLTSADWSTFNGKQAAGNYITALTGDGTASGPGSATFTLATVNGNVGSFGSATAAPTFTVNGKGLITAAGNATITPNFANVLGGTAGSVIFSNGTNLAQDNANFFWDDTNNQLGIGSSSPENALTVLSNGGTVTAKFYSLNQNAALTIGQNSLVSTDVSDTVYKTVLDNSSSFSSGHLFQSYNGTSFVNALAIAGSGNVGIGTTSPGTILAIGSSTKYINLSNTATSTFSSGINITSGCFAIGGTCVGSSGVTDLSVRVTKSAVQSVTSTLTVISFDTESYDTNSMHDNVTNNSRITFTTAGKYQVSAGCPTDGNTAFRIQVRLNGSTIIHSSGAGNAGSAVGNGPVAAFQYNFSAADYIEILCAYISSTNNTLSGASGPYITAYKTN